MRPKQAKEGGDVIQELEPLNIVLQCQLVKGGIAAQEDEEDLHVPTDLLSKQ